MRRASMINQVLSCPKCGNMVRVLPPSDWKLDDETIPSLPPQLNRPEDQQSSDGSENAKTDFSSFEDIDHLIAKEQSPTSTPVIPKPPRKSRAAATQTIEPPQKSPVQNSTETPVLPDQNWTSTATKHRQKLIMALVAGMGVLLLTIGGITAFVVNSGKSITANTVDSAKDEKSDIEKKGGANEADEPTTLPNPSTEKTGKPDPESVQPNSLDGSTNETDSPEESDPQNPSPTTTDPGSDETATNSTDTPLVNDTPLIENPLIDNPLPKREGWNDPLGDLNGGPSPQDLNIGSSIDSATKISTRMGELNDLLSTAGMSLSSIRGIADSSRRSSFGRSKYFIEMPVRNSINLNQMLTNNVSGIQYNGIDLHEFLNESSNLAGAPISIHVESFRAAGLELNGNVNMLQQNVDLSTALDLGLDPLKLKKEVFAAENQIVIVAQGWNDLMEQTFTLPKLEDTSEQGLASLVRRIRGMFAESTWTNDTVIEMKDDQLFVKQVPQVQFQIGRLLEKLIAAQALNNNASDKMAAATLQSEWASSHEARETELKFQPAPDTKIRKFISRLEEQAQVKILIDWNSLSQGGWWPSTMVPGEFDESNLQNALFQLSRAMKCSYRAIDATTFELLSSQEADRRPELQVYPIKDILSEKLTSEVLLETLGRTFQREANLLQVGFDEDSQAIVVIGPQSIQVQFEAVITRLRAGS